MPSRTDSSPSPAPRPKTARAKARTPDASDTSRAEGTLSEPTREAMIQMLAYRFYERRGCVSGAELQDWLEAEMEVDRQLAARKPTTRTQRTTRPAAGAKPIQRKVESKAKPSKN